MKNSFFQHAACEWHVIFLDDQQNNHICIALNSQPLHPPWKCRSSRRLGDQPSNIVLSEGRDWFPELEFAHGNEIKEMIPLPPWFS